MEKRTRRDKALTTFLLLLLLLPIFATHVSNGHSDGIKVTSSPLSQPTSAMNVITVSSIPKAKVSPQPESMETVSPMSPSQPPSLQPVSPASPEPLSLEPEASQSELPESPQPQSWQPMSLEQVLPEPESLEPTSSQELSPEPVSPQPLSPLPLSPEELSPPPKSSEPVSPPPVSPLPVSPQPVSPQPLSPPTLSPEELSPPPESPEPESLESLQPAPLTMKTEEEGKRDREGSETSIISRGSRHTNFPEDVTPISRHKDLLSDTDLTTDITTPWDKDNTLDVSTSFFNGTAISPVTAKLPIPSQPSTKEASDHKDGHSDHWHPTSENWVMSRRNHSYPEYWSASTFRPSAPGGWPILIGENDTSSTFTPSTVIEFFRGDETRTSGILEVLHKFETRCQKERQRQQHNQPSECDGTEWDDIPFGEPCTGCTCTCHENCYDFGDCCLGRLLFDASPKNEVPECHSRFLTPSKVASHFFMVDRCQEGWEGDEVWARCVNVSSKGMNSQPPVWSPLTRSTYRNEHCAVCNGERRDKLWPWELTVFCDFPRRVELSQDLKDLIRQVTGDEECRLGFNPPQGSSFEQCSPVTVMASAIPCVTNASVLDKLNHRLFVSTCDTFFGKNGPGTYVMMENGNFLVETGGWNETAGSSSMWCALCMLRMMGENCGLQGIDTPFPFMLVMSSKALLNVTSSSAAGRACLCAPDEMYDTYESRCRKLHCSVSRRVEGSVCVPLAKRLKGLGFELHLRLTPTDHAAPILVDNVAFFSDFAMELLRAFDLLAPVRDMFQPDIFQVVFQVENHDNGNTNSSPVILRTVDLHIRVVLRHLVDVRELDKLLLEITHSRWNFSLGLGTGYREYEASPLYSPGLEGDMVYDILIPRGGNSSDYKVDGLADWVPDYGDVPVRVDEYLPVLYTLNCTKVSFTLSTPGRKAKSYSSHVMNKSAHNRSAPPRESVLHSVNPSTGQVVLRVDRETGSVYHEPSGQTISFEYVEFLQDDENDVVMVCADQLYGTHPARPSAPLVLGKFFSEHIIYLSVACQSLSVVCLFLALLTHCLFAELRTLPGKNTMALVASLLLAMLLFEVGVARVESPALCITMGVVIHFSLLSSFTWMLICSVHMYRDFSQLLSSRHHLHPASSSSSSTTFSKHVLVSLLVPSLIVACTLLGNWLLGDGRDCNGWVDLGYGRGICYLSNIPSLILASVLPVCLSVVANLVLFLFTVSSVRLVSGHTKRLTQTRRQQMAIYFRMSTLTGINWLVGAATAVIDYVVVWYIFILLCGLQGLYVFIAFVCNRRVFSLYRALFACKKKAKNEDPPEVPGSQTSTRSTPLDE